MKLDHQEVVSLAELTTVLRGLADQLEGGQALSLQGWRVPVADPLVVRLGFRQQDGVAVLELGLHWPDPGELRPVVEPDGERPAVPSTLEVLERMLGPGPGPGGEPPATPPAAAGEP